jgi:hypothetical protein
VPRRVHAPRLKCATPHAGADADAVCCRPVGPSLSLATCAPPVCAFGPVVTPLRVWPRTLTDDRHGESLSSKPAGDATTTPAGSLY